MDKTKDGNCDDFGSFQPKGARTSIVPRVPVVCVRAIKAEIVSWVSRYGGAEEIRAGLLMDKYLVTSKYRADVKADGLRQKVPAFMPL